MDYSELLFSFFLTTLSFCAFALAWGMFFCKGYSISAVVSICAVLMICLSAKGWLTALVSSGRSAKALFSPAPLAYGVMLLGSLTCLVLSHRLLKRRRIQEEIAAEEQE